MIWEYVAKFGLMFLEMFISNQQKKAELQLKWLNAVKRVNDSALESATLNKTYDDLVAQQDARLKRGPSPGA
jgi:hypothetical protein